MIKKCEIGLLVAIIGLILLAGFLFQPRNIAVRVKADEPEIKEAVLISSVNPNFSKLDYKIPWSPLHFSYELVDHLKVNNPETIKKLIRCESNGENVSLPDSDGIISDGILQYHRSKKEPEREGSGTWEEFSKESGITGSPNNIIDAIRMTDWAIDNRKIGHWSCYWILKRKGIL